MKYFISIIILLLFSCSEDTSTKEESSGQENERRFKEIQQTYNANSCEVYDLFLNDSIFTYQIQEALLTPKHKIVCEGFLQDIYNEESKYWAIFDVLFGDSKFKLEVDKNFIKQNLKRYDYYIFVCEVNNIGIPYLEIQELEYELEIDIAPDLLLFIGKLVYIEKIE